MATAKVGGKAATKASSKSATVTTGGNTLTLRVSAKAKLPTILKEVERQFKLAGCPGCRSGKDRIVFQDKVIGNIK